MEEDMNGKTILILGGGVGGIATANALRTKLPTEHRVIVVDKNAEYIFAPSLLWVMVGWRRPEQITKSLNRLLHSGIEIVQADVQAIDPGAQQVVTSSGKLGYDYLVVALGAALAPDTFPGFSEAAQTPYDLQGAVSLWSSLQSFEGGRVAVLVTSLPYKCPAAPYETALLLDDYLRKRGIRERCELEVYTPETLPMGVAGTAMGKAVVGMLESNGIRFNSQLKPIEIYPLQKELRFADHEACPFDLLAGVPPHVPPQAVRESSLANDSGWIPVNKNTLQTNQENVYAIGDIAAITLTNGKPLPKAGVFAEGQALTVAQRISREIHGKAAQSEFDGMGFCWIETGNGSAGFTSGEFYAEPDPIVPLPRSSRVWHWGKVLFEKYWLGEGISRGIYRQMLIGGAKLLGLDISL